MKHVEIQPSIQKRGIDLQPSIPSKYPPRPVRGKPETKAFGSTDKRFVSNANDVPGPAAYASNFTDTFVKKSPSISKLGYLTNKAPKISIFPDSFTPGPGTYEIKGVGSIERDTGTAAFLPSGKGRVPFPEPLPIPGPCSYKVEFPEKPKRLQKVKSATFASESKRESFLELFSAAPGPGRYNLRKDKVILTNTIDWSKDKADRFKNCGLFPNSATVGVGTFETTPKAESLRDVGSYDGPYLGKQWDDPKGTDHNFGADKNRFKHSFCGRLDLEALLPGPGAYSPNIGLRQNDDYRCTSAFRNKSPNRASVLKAPEHRTPGPAYYSPKKVSGKAFFQNIDMKWI